MHRQIALSIPSEHSEGVISRLRENPGLIGLAVSRGSSLQPPGDVIHVQVLNREADEVLRVVQELPAGTRYTVATAELTSLSDVAQDEAIKNDNDEALWEEIESGLRQSMHVTGNYLTLMALGGVIAAAGMFMTGASQAVAFVSASIVAPGFEPVAKAPIGVVLRDRDVTLRALRSFLAGYLALIGAAACTYLLAHFGGFAGAPALLANAEVHSLLEPDWTHMVLSGAGAVAGAIMVVTHRDVVIAGPLIALVLIPGAALLGIGFAIADPAVIAGAAKRFGFDVLLVFCAAAATAALKQLLHHRRKPIM